MADEHGPATANDSGEEITRRTRRVRLVLLRNCFLEEGVKTMAGEEVMVERDQAEQLIERGLAQAVI